MQWKEMPQVIMLSGRNRTRLPASLSALRPRFSAYRVLVSRLTCGLDVFHRLIQEAANSLQPLLMFQRPKIQQTSLIPVVGPLAAAEFTLPRGTDEMQWNAFLLLMDVLVAYQFVCDHLSRNGELHDSHVCGRHNRLVKGNDQLPVICDVERLVRCDGVKGPI